MDIVFNTRHINSAASMFYKKAFEKNNKIKINDWENSHTYDVALYMTYESDLKELVRVKKNNKSLLVSLGYTLKEIPLTEFYLTVSVELC